MVNYPISQEELMGDPSAVGDDLLWSMCYDAGQKPEDLALTEAERKDYMRYINEVRNGVMPG